MIKVRFLLLFRVLITGVLIFCSISKVRGQFQDSVRVNRAKSKYMPLIIPGIISGIGLYALTDDSQIDRYEIVEERNEYFNSFNYKADNYLQFFPAGIAYGLKLCHVNSRDDFLNMTIKLAKSELLMIAVVYPLKSITKGSRPDTGALTTFPSGHTAQAFLAAAFLDDQFRKVSPWVSVSGYTIATAVGVSRILNNRHWVSDVFFGAGLGLASYRISQLTHQYRWSGKKRDIAVLPFLIDGDKAGLIAAWRF